MYSLRSLPIIVLLGQNAPEKTESTKDILCLRVSHKTSIANAEPDKSMIACYDKYERKRYAHSTDRIAVAQCAEKVLGSSLEFLFEKTVFLTTQARNPFTEDVPQDKNQKRCQFLYKIIIDPSDGIRISRRGIEFVNTTVCIVLIDIL